MVTASTSVLQLVDALGVGVEADRLGAVLRPRRSSSDVEPVTEQTFLPFRSSGPVIVLVVLADQQLLAGDVVRARPGRRPRGARR